MSVANGRCMMSMVFVAKCIYLLLSLVLVSGFGVGVLAVVVVPVDRPAMVHSLKVKVHSPTAIESLHALLVRASNCCSRCCSRCFLAFLAFRIVLEILVPLVILRFLHC